MRQNSWGRGCGGGPEPQSWVFEAEAKVEAGHM